MNIGYYNGTMGDVESIRIPMQDRAMFFGDGVYDGSLTPQKSFIFNNASKHRVF